MKPATLNSVLIVRATIVIPRSGIWWADVQLADDTEQSGPVTIEIAGLTLQGTIVVGGTYRARGWWRVVGGAGGWRKPIPKLQYRDENGVQLSKVISDAAREAGETVGALPATRIGPAFVRPEGPASRVLESLIPESWYVDEVGSLQLGARPAVESTVPFATSRHPGSRLQTVASDDISELLPGSLVNGLETGTVRHELTPDGLRTHLWAVGSASGLTATMRRVHEALAVRDAFHRSYEYAVIGGADGYLDLQAVRPSLGVPDLANVVMRQGVPGGGGDPELGSTVLVGFIDGDPCRPYVCSYEGEAGAGWVPQKARLNASLEVAIGADAAVVKLAGGAQFVALENLVKARLTELVAPLILTAPLPNDGGAAIQTAVKVSLQAAGWNMGTGAPPTMAAQKVKVT